MIDRRARACLPLRDFSSRRAGAGLLPEPGWRQTSCRPTTTTSRLVPSCRRAGACLLPVWMAADELPPYDRAVDGDRVVNGGRQAAALRVGDEPAGMRRA